VPHAAQLLQLKEIAIMSIHTINRPVSVPPAVPERVVVDVNLDDAVLPAADETLVAELVDDETLVEEVSIDGMCGVY
jgi:mycofactocin precursor